MRPDDAARPDTRMFVLATAERRAVNAQLRQRALRCGACGSADFAIGGALYLGFLFTSEEHRDYMVALTCTNPTCPAPRTGIRLHESELVEQGEQQPARWKGRRAGMLCVGGLVTATAVAPSGLSLRARAGAAAVGTILLATAGRRSQAVRRDGAGAMHSVVPRARFGRDEPVAANGG